MLNGATYMLSVLSSLESIIRDYTLWRQHPFEIPSR